jgi:hypothetical protein
VLAINDDSYYYYYGCCYCYCRTTYLMTTVMIIIIFSLLRRLYYIIIIYLGTQRYYNNILCAAHHHHIILLYGSTIRIPQTARVPSTILLQYVAIWETRDDAHATVCQSDALMEIDVFLIHIVTTMTYWRRWSEVIKDKFRSTTYNLHKITIYINIINVKRHYALSRIDGYTTSSIWFHPCQLYRSTYSLK